MSEEAERKRKLYAILGWGAFAVFLAWEGGYCSPPEDEPDRYTSEVPGTNPTLAVYTDDMDCEDIGFEHFVAEGDPNGLDSDGDGIACEGW